MNFLQKMKSTLSLIPAYSMYLFKNHMFPACVYVFPGFALGDHLVSGPVFYGAMIGVSLLLLATCVRVQYGPEKGKNKYSETIKNRFPESCPSLCCFWSCVALTSACYFGDAPAGEH